MFNPVLRAGEEKEEEERRGALYELRDRRRLARSHPDGRVRYGVSESEHGTTLVPGGGWEVCQAALPVPCPRLPLPGRV